MAVEIGSDFKEVASAKKVGRYYIPTRYPDGLPGGVPPRYFDDPKEAEETMQLAKMLSNWLKRK